MSSTNAISDINTDNPIVREIHNLLRFYNVFTNVNFIWCKGHSNIIGNELADYFARQSVLQCPNNNNLCKVPLSYLKSAVRSK